MTELPPTYKRPPKGTTEGPTPAHREGKGEGKVCGGCNRFLTYDNFPWNADKTKNSRRSGRYYRGGRCLDCKRALCRTRHKERGKHYSRKRLYGMSWEEYDAMAITQGRACAICGNAEMPIDKRTGKPYELAVDHDHETGQIRALLCPNCNNGLGCFRDDVQKLHAAVAYLKKYKLT